MPLLNGRRTQFEQAVELVEREINDRRRRRRKSIRKLDGDDVNSYSKRERKTNIIGVDRCSVEWKSVRTQRFAWGAQTVNWY